MRGGGGATKRRARDEDGGKGGGAGETATRTGGVGRRGGVVGERTTEGVGRANLVADVGGAALGRVVGVVQLLVALRAAERGGGGGFSTESGARMRAYCIHNIYIYIIWIDR